MYQDNTLTDRTAVFPTYWKGGKAAFFANYKLKLHRTEM